MNQSKFSLADVLSVLAALAFGFVCFMGANFFYIDKDVVWGMPHTMGCIIMAIVCTVLLFLTAYGAKLLKRTSRNFKSAFILEVLMLVLFILIAWFFASIYSPFTHFFTVTAQKEEIKKNLQEGIEQAEKMFAEYETYAETRVNLYRNALNRVVRAENTDPVTFKNFGFLPTNEVTDEIQIENKMFTVRADLFPTNYSDTINNNGIKEVATEWLNTAKNSTSGWKPIGIVRVVNEIESNTTNWRDTLVALSEVRQLGEEDGNTDNFKYKISFTDVKKYFTQLKSPQPISTGFALLAYFLMLLSYVLTIRSTKSKYGFRVLVRQLFSKKEQNASNSDIDY